MVPNPSTEKPAKIIIHGDHEDKTLTKAVWSLLSGKDVKIQSTEDVSHLIHEAQDAVLVMVNIVDENDPDIGIGHILFEDDRVVATVMAVTGEISPEQRIKIMAGGFDMSMNFSFTDFDKFRDLLLNKIKKGRTRLNNRIMEEEYLRFQASLSASPDAFIVFDQNRKLFFVSDHYKRFYEERADMLVRGLDVMDSYETLARLNGVEPGDPRYEPMKEFWEKMEGQAEFTLDNGRTWRVKAAPLAGGQGTIVITTDITNFVKQKQEVEDKSKELEEALSKEQEASAIQKQFINMVSHEFRTPLSIIDGNAQILMRRGQELNGDEFNRKTKTIRSAVSRLINMMDGVLSSNMLRTGKLEVAPEPLDIKRLITDICDEHQELSTITEISWTVDKLPDVAVIDKKVISLALSNLLSNAIKFSTNDPRVFVEAREVQGHIYITVQDSGIGIPENELDKVFDCYYRATTSSGIAGSGIGLSLVKELVDLHGGDVSITSKQNEGTIVVITVPNGVV